MAKKLIEETEERGAPPKKAASPRAAGEVKPRLIPGTDDSDGEVAASPDEEKNVEQAVDKCLQMIHGRQSRDQILKALHSPNDSVAQTVGRLACQLIVQVSEQKGVATSEPLSEEEMRECAGYVVPELLKVGCAAGIFPFEDDDSDEPGGGPSEFDEQVRMAMLEAVKAYGEKVLRDPNASERSQEAGNDWAGGIAQEVDNGTASPEFMGAAGQGGGAQPMPEGNTDAAV